MQYEVINPEVENALRNNVPVVALESTIITHGMPYPRKYKNGK
jgi:pseudouridine-5'-phosphate glycosidase